MTEELEKQVLRFETQFEKKAPLSFWNVLAVNISSVWTKSMTVRVSDFQKHYPRKWKHESIHG